MQKQRMGGRRERGEDGGRERKRKRKREMEEERARWRNGGGGEEEKSDGHSERREKRESETGGGDCGRRYKVTGRGWPTGRVSSSAATQQRPCIGLGPKQALANKPDAGCRLQTLKRWVLMRNHGGATVPACVCVCFLLRPFARVRVG